MKRILFELPMANEEPAADGARPALATNPAETGFAPLSPGRFRKELIREGTWVHPTQHFQLTVTRERMQRWVEKFRLLRERGIRIPVPFGHSYDPKDNAGFLEELVLEGNALFAVLVIPRAEDAGKLGATVKDVSISINPDFRDGEGRRYGEVIEHVALTTRPLVGGQGDFLPLQLPDGSQVEVWRFSPASLRPRAQGGSRSADNGQPAGHEDEEQADRAPTGRAPDLSLQEEQGRRADRRAKADPTGADKHTGSPTGRKPASESTVGTGLQPCPKAAAEAPVPSKAQTSSNSPAAADAQTGGKAHAAPGRQAPRDASVRSEAPALAFARELAQLRQSALERELGELLRAGRLTPAMREPARRLLALEGPVSLQLAAGETRLDVAAEVRVLLASIPEHALIDLRQRTLAESPRSVGEMTEERAAQLAEENRRLAHLESARGGSGSGASAT